MAQNFVAQLPNVSRADLVYGNQCGICREDYGTNIAGSDIVTEDAVRLPCGHEFGFECLSRWLSPNGGQNSCPNCRHEVFPTAPNIHNGVAPLRLDNISANLSDILSRIIAGVESVHSNVDSIHADLAGTADIAAHIESIHSNFDNILADLPDNSLAALPDMADVAAAIGFARSNLYEGNTLSEQNRAPFPRLPRLPPVLTAQRPGVRGSIPVASEQQRRTSPRFQNRTAESEQQRRTSPRFQRR